MEYDVGSRAVGLALKRKPEKFEWRRRGIQEDRQRRERVSTINRWILNGWIGITATLFFGAMGVVLLSLYRK